MKPWRCGDCNKEIQVYDEYEPEYCCDGRECGCMGRETNPLFCDECEEKREKFCKEVKEHLEEVGLPF
jgi:hypothetical protein